MIPIDDNKVLRILRDVGNELKRAEDLHGERATMHSIHEGYAIIQEEVDEFWEEIKQDHIAASVREAYHVAAMATRFIHDFE